MASYRRGRMCAVATLALLGCAVVRKRCWVLGLNCSQQQSFSGQTCQAQLQPSAASRELMRFLDSDILTCPGSRKQAGHARWFAKKLSGLPNVGRAAREALYNDSVPLLDVNSMQVFPRFDRCILVEKTWRLTSRLLEDDLEALIRSIPKALCDAGVNVTISRFDLFHAHLFHRSDTSGSAGYGLLFHASEYPAKCEAFPFNLGFCQRDSELAFSEERMQFRNILLLIPEHEPVSAYLLNPEVPPVKMMFDELHGSGPPFYALDEALLGRPIADVYFLPGKELPLAWQPRHSGLLQPT